ncbi:DNA topoisomerase [Dinochytrium kinnereticum]|nr:DNA topoisomerase [Dinochytrium kinnereticum]
MRILAVAEKNRASKEIAGIIGGRYQTKDTRLRFVKNYEFETTYNGAPCKVVMTAVAGHLMNHEFNPEHKNWDSTPIVACFDDPVKKIVTGNNVIIKANLEKEARKANLLMIWTDCDDEGENIGLEIKEVCEAVNRRLVVKRARFSTFGPREIKNAWDRLGDLNMLQALAIDTRSEIDLRIGAAFTRLQTLRLRSQFPQIPQSSPLSYGSCQFPTLGFVVDQYERFKSFSPEPFWGIDVFVDISGEKRQKFNWARHRLFDHQIALAIYEMCLLNPVGRITSVREVPTEKWRPIPLATLELLKFCSSYYRIPSHRTVQIAEELYLQGLISYPRTETDEFIPGTNLQDIISQFTGNAEYGNHAQCLLNGEFRHPRSGGHNDNAHPPIHPLKDAGQNLNEEHKKVFNYIVRRFLACCSDNAKGKQTQITLEIAGEVFSASGLVVIRRNYLDIYPFDKWESTAIPNFAMGQEITPSVINLSTGQTSPPSLLSESDLIAVMEKHSIGTDATIHDHIKKILDREYVNKENERFSPTQLGMGLAKGYRAINLDLSLMKPYLRSQMEASIKAVKLGEKPREGVLRETLDEYKRAFLVVERNVNQLENALFEVFTREE